MDPIQIETLESEVWGWLASALSTEGSPLRLPTVATVDAHGVPQARVVVLRIADAWMLQFHTDVRSPKVTELRERDAVTWLFYDPARMLQIRASGRASLHTDDAIADQGWAESPLASRAPYFGASPSGQVIDAPAPAVFVRDEAHSMQGRPQFCAVRCAITELDVLQLHESGHRRAKVRPGEAVWVSP